MGWGEVGSWALQQWGRGYSTDLRGLYELLGGLCPAQEHLTKASVGAGTHSLNPGLGLWALPTQSRHLFLIPTKALYGNVRPGDVIIVGLNPSSSPS